MAPNSARIEVTDVAPVLSDKTLTATVLSGNARVTDVRAARFAKAVQAQRPEITAPERFEAACREIKRDPANLGVTALIGLWYPDLQENKPKFFTDPLTGTVQEIAEAMHGYAKIGVQHIMFQVEPYTAEARKRLTEALQFYRDMEQHLRG